MPGIASEKERIVMVQVRRTIPILQPPGDNLRRTLIVFQTDERQPSALCISGGNRLRAVASHQVCRLEVKGQLTAPMTCPATHSIDIACQSARRNRYPPRLPFQSRRGEALLLIRLWKREASLQPSSSLPPWTSTAPGPSDAGADHRQPYKARARGARGTTAGAARHHLGRTRPAVPSRFQTGPGNRSLQGRVEEGIALTESNALVAVDG
ncbi:hypothetical protein [Thermogemmatispora onikobensis]|uniref:hypothetical protein n=1 Tax=Thermogemmatispora onikobensis TaxID=732234 RepID=UPI00114CF633|nr:hypothetical protein [Thermogemmatispora onikobensis]